MLWSDDGKASTWSAPERFITGVTEGWQATWIAADKGWPVHIAESRKGADNPGPKVMPLFRRGFTVGKPVRHARSEEHTSELQSLMRISYAVFCLKKKKNTRNIDKTEHTRTCTSNEQEQRYNH